MARQLSTMFFSIVARFVKGDLMANSLNPSSHESKFEIMELSIESRVPMSPALMAWVADARFSRAVS
ncbi:hypothetical protein IEQ34_009507 [Dendrobium chrysotoxum]|uniref:Uncharacterized protein n=1 Tax=Dendrobium chrysotoxum TaxID=161865 RepID=A0AAV7H0S3_DENCH|nr:hypothetical protein IEQ34_009507 [Dendrobium chrysotoxum]